MKIYVNGYVCFEEFGRTKITTVDNYETCMRDSSKVCYFDGSVEQAAEYVEKYF